MQQAKWFTFKSTTGSLASEGAAVRARLQNHPALCTADRLRTCGLSPRTNELVKNKVTKGLLSVCVEQSED